ncbi:MAG: Magnesium and cobalt transport protein CorA [uncultured Gemmatimonadetes bacterium]|uniref:Magnesium transport protein CorA n=1 Tax=uncultured Gemmatimonadota bacterium TaxID=203437 RepID=A0A6J4KDC7_9BACT|nr:MAG: Magnesium and cobalt transport protein CorA [uncultured Gemmatimonadota bacterium]
MSAGAPVESHLDLFGLDVDDVRTRSRIQAYVDEGRGVHPVPLARGLELYTLCQAAQSPTDTTTPLVWIDVAAPGDREALFLRDKLGFHPLAVEDTVRGRQRPKLDRYPGYFFLVFYAAAINEDRQRMALHEVHVFIGRRYIVTVHDHEISPLNEVLVRWRANSEGFVNVGALAHAIVDTIVDGYFPVLDHFADRVDEMESRIYSTSTAGQIASLEEVLGMRRELTTLRRVLGPGREVLGTLVRRDLPFLSPDLMLYFQDVYDHSIRVVEETEALRDRLGMAIEAQMTVSSNQLNQTMRLMAAWSIILMAMAWVAGVYGMNFHVMPELQWRYGYEWALGLMATIGSSIFLYFRRKRWI